LRFNAHVTDIRVIDSGFEVHYESGSGADSVTAANLVLGYGTIPHVPECARPFLGEGVYHTAQFRENQAAFAQAGRVAVFGSGQSAGECVLSLLQNQVARRYSIDWFTRGAGFLPMEYSKLGLEHFSPEYIDYFHGLPAPARDRIRSGQDFYYKGMSGATIANIYDTLYELQLEDDMPPVTMAGNTELVDMERHDNGFVLHLRHRELDRQFVRHADVVLLGTGHAYGLPEFMNGLLPVLERDEQGRVNVNRDYRARRTDGREGSIFIQNGEIHTHGIGAPDLGLGAYRNASIVNTLLGRPAYRIDRKNVFQVFGAPAGAEEPATESLASMQGESA
jgi:lysine N6-hydroxylase